MVSSIVTDVQPFTTTNVGPFSSPQEESVDPLASLFPQPSQPEAATRQLTVSTDLPTLHVSGITGHVFLCVWFLVL